MITWIRRRVPMDPCLMLRPLQREHHGSDADKQEPRTINIRHARMAVIFYHAADVGEAARRGETNNQRWLGKTATRACVRARTLEARLAHAHSHSKKMMCMTLSPHRRHCKGAGEEAHWYSAAHPRSAKTARVSAGYSARRADQLASEVAGS